MSWLFGLTPRKYQSGEKDVTGGITRTGDEMLRTQGPLQKAVYSSSAQSAADYSCLRCSYVTATHFYAALTALHKNCTHYYRPSGA